MQTIIHLISKFTELPIERLNAIIALAGICLAAFAIYVVLEVAT